MSAYKWAILLLVTVALLASACTVASAQSTGGVVKISSPPKNGNAGPTERVSGKAQLSKGYSLWIVPVRSNRWQGTIRKPPRSRWAVMRAGRLVSR